MSLRGCPHTRFESMVTHFVNMSCGRLHGRDPSFPLNNAFRIHWHRGNAGVSQGRAMLYGAEESIARVWYFAFREYQWDSTTGGQNITVELTSPHFDEELSFAHVRRVANRDPLTVLMSVEIQNVVRLRHGLARHGLAGPPAPPRRPPVPSQAPALTNFAAQGGQTVPPHFGDGAGAQ